MATDADDETRAIVSREVEGTVMAMPMTYSIEQPTMALRWNGDVLEQAFMNTSLAGSEIVWKPIPSIGTQ